jgi:hypothetical protein
VKLNSWPDASVAVVKTGVAPLRLFTTTTLVSVTLPEFFTVPLYVSKLPGIAGLVGQTWVTTMLGVVVREQVAEALAVAPTAEHASLPVAVTALLTEHVSAGAVKVAEKLADAPGARLGTVNTVLGTV